MSIISVGTSVDSLEPKQVEKLRSSFRKNMANPKYKTLDLLNELWVSYGKYRLVDIVTLFWELMHDPKRAEESLKTGVWNHFVVRLYCLLPKNTGLDTIVFLQSDSEYYLPHSKEIPAVIDLVSTYCFNKSNQALCSLVAGYLTPRSRFEIIQEFAFKNFMLINDSKKEYLSDIDFLYQQLVKYKFTALSETLGHYRSSVEPLLKFMLKEMHGTHWRNALEASRIRQMKSSANTTQQQK